MVAFSASSFQNLVIFGLECLHLGFGFLS